jgi:hypothetical protein
MLPCDWWNAFRPPTSDRCLSTSFWKFEFLASYYYEDSDIAFSLTNIDYCTLNLDICLMAHYSVRSFATFRVSSLMN